LFDVLFRVEQNGSRSSCSEASASSRTLKAALKMAGLDGQSDTNHDFVSRGDGGEKTRSRRTDVRSQRKGSRENDGARMKHGANVGIVGIDAARKCSVEKRGLHRIRGTP
jgi:hypothetical protein